MPKAWVAAPPVTFPSVDEVLDALGGPAAKGPAEVREIRMLAWRLAADPWRQQVQRSSGQGPSQRDRDRENMEALFELEVGSLKRNALLLAELARQLGRFEESLAFHKEMEPEEDLALVAVIRDRALARDTGVARILRTPGSRPTREERDQSRREMETIFTAMDELDPAGAGESEE